MKRKQRYRASVENTRGRLHSEEIPSPKTADSAAAPLRHPLTSARRFSEFALWQKQRDYFHSAGSRAWQEILL